MGEVWLLEKLVKGTALCMGYSKGCIARGVQQGVCSKGCAARGVQQGVCSKGCAARGV